MLHQKQVLKIVEQLATKYNLPKQVVEAVVLNQFKCLREWIAEPKMNIIMLPNFGKFMPSTKKIETIEKLNYIREVEKAIQNGTESITHI